MKKFLSVLLALAVAFTFTFGSTMSAFAVTPNKADADTAIATQVQASYEAISEAATKLVEKTFTYEDGYLVSAGDSYKLYVDNAAKGLVSKETVQKAVDVLVANAKTTVQTTAEAQYGFGYPLATPADDAAYTQANINQAVLNVKNAGIAQANAINAAAVLGALSGDYYTMTIITDDVVKAYEKAATDAIAVLEAKVDDYSNLADDKMAVSTESVNGTTQAAVSGLTGNQTPQAIVKGIISTQKNAISTAKTALGSSTEVNAYITAISAYQTAAENAENFILGHKRTSTEDYYIAPVPTKADIANDTTVATAKSQAITEINAAMESKILVVKNGLNSALNDYNQYATLTTALAKDKANLEKAIANLDAQVAAAKEVYAARINDKNVKSTAAVASKKGEIITEINGYATTWAAFKDDTTGPNTTEELLVSMTTILDNIATVKKEAALIGDMKDVNGKPYVDADALAEDLEDAIASLYAGGTLADALSMLGSGSQEEALLSAKQDYIGWIEGTNNNLNPKDSKGNVLTSPWNKANAPGTATNIVIAPFTTTTYTVNNAKLYEEADAEALTALVEETKEAITAATSIADIKAIFATANDKYEAIETTTQHVTNWGTVGKVGAAYTKANYEQELSAYAGYFVSKIDTAKYPTQVRTANGVLENVVYPIVYTAKTADELAAKVAEAKAAVDAIKSIEAIKTAGAEVDALISKINTPATIADKDAIIAAADAKAAYDLIPGKDDSYVTKRLALAAAITAYEKADATAINDAYAALAKKTVITTDDAAAIEALRAQFDAHDEFVVKYNNGTSTVTVTEANLSSANAPYGLEVKLSDAKVKAVTELLINLPSEVKATDKAQIEAARAAYEALTLAEKNTVMNAANGVLYKNLLNAEADLAKVSKWTATDVKASLFDMNRSLSIWKTSKTSLKVTVKGDVSDIKDNGYTVKYTFYKKAPGAKSYKAIKTTTSKTYKYTNLKKGTNKFQVKVKVYDADGKLVATKMTYYRAVKVK